MLHICMYIHTEREVRSRCRFRWGDRMGASIDFLWESQHLVTSTAVSFPCICASESVPKEVFELSSKETTVVHTTSYKTF